MEKEPDDTEDDNASEVVDAVGAALACGARKTTLIVGSKPRVPRVSRQWKSHRRRAEILIASGVSSSAQRGGRGTAPPVSLKPQKFRLAQRRPRGHFNFQIYSATP